jgi:deoxyribodipyrimidine photo-lyase
MAAQRVLIYLLRRDLRLPDNPVFHEIHKLSKHPYPPFTHILPLYVFAAQQIEVSGFLLDPRAKSPFPEARSETAGFWRCGPHRAKFLAESVWDLGSQLEQAGSGLVIRVGLLGPVVEDLLNQYQKVTGASVSAIWMTEEEGVEEKRDEFAVRKAAERAGVDFRLWLDEKYFIDE